jgi:glycosyltransferase involved in cell wall biosynthesis
MMLAIDVREACRDKQTGKGVWTRRFVDELLRRDRACVLLTDADVPDAWKNKARVERITATGIRWHFAAASLAKRIADAYFSPTSYIAPSILGKDFPAFVVVHDLIAFRDEPHDRRATIIERLTLARAVRSARITFAISESTKTDLLARVPALAPERVVPIFAGPSWQDGAGPAAPNGLSITCIATLCPRKNQLRLIRAFDALPSPLRERATLTLIGGRGWHDGEIVHAAANTPGVEWKKYLPAAECDALLRSSAVFAFPSLYEGFGLPVLDSFLRGVPVLTSDRGSLKEVAGGAALLCDPEDVTSISAGLERLLTDDALRADLARKGEERAKRFTWEKTVGGFLAAVDAAA